jgi:hypothetical protein
MEISRINVIHFHIDIISKCYIIHRNADLTGAAIRYEAFNYRKLRVKFKQHKLNLFSENPIIKYTL